MVKVEIDPEEILKEARKAKGCTKALKYTIYGMLKALEAAEEEFAHKEH